MSATESAAAGHDRQGLSLASTLRRCLDAGVLLVHRPTQRAALTPRASEILGVSATHGPEVALEELPEPVVELIRNSITCSPDGPDSLVELALGGDRRIAVRVATVPVSPPQPPSELVLLIYDLAGVTQCEAHLHQLNRLASLGTLAASMAHEIKNALVAGKTFIDLLLEKNAASEVGEVVRRELGRIDALVSRMLRFSGPAQAAFEPVHLHEVLDHSLRLLQPQMESNSIQCVRSFQADPDLVNGDEFELQQALVNLCLNALEAMGSGGTLTLTTQALTVAPARGSAAPPAPVSPEHLAHLFEPFFTTKPGGTGLGLAITQRILQQHLGTISAQSQPGKGSTFILVLPLLRSP